MTQIAITALYPDSSPYANGQVTIRLVDAGAGGAIDGGTVVSSQTVRLDSDGTYTIDLTPNADVTPPGTFYALTVNQSSPTVVRYIEVPDSDDVIAWDDDDIQRLVSDPPTMIPAPSAGTAGQVLGVTDTGNGKRYDLIDVEGGGGGVVEVVAGDNITVDNTDPERPVVSAEPGGGGAPGVQVTVAVDEMVEIEVDGDGNLVQTSSLILPGAIDSTVDRHPLTVLPDPELVNPDQEFTVLFADGSESTGAVWVDETPSSAALTWGSSIGPFLGYLVSLGDGYAMTFTGGEATTATGGPVVLAVSDTYDFGTMPAAVDEIHRFLTDLFANLTGYSLNWSEYVGAGFSIPLVLSADTPGADTIEITDTGTGDSTVSTWLSDGVANAGYLGRVCGIGDAIAGGLGAFAEPDATPTPTVGWFDHDDYEDFTGGTHLCTSNCDAHMRAVTVKPVHAANNGGTAKWTAKRWPPRTSFQEVTVFDESMWDGAKPVRLDQMIERIAYAAVNGLTGGGKFPELP